MKLSLVPACPASYDANLRRRARIRREFSSSNRPIVDKFRRSGPSALLDEVLGSGRIDFICAATGRDAPFSAGEQWPWQAIPSLENSGRWNFQAAFAAIGWRIFALARPIDDSGLLQVIYLDNTVTEHNSATGAQRWRNR